MYLQPSFGHYSCVDYSLGARLVVICILTSEEFRAPVGSNDTERILELTGLITWNSRGLDLARSGPPRLNLALELGHDWGAANLPPSVDNKIST